MNGEIKALNGTYLASVTKAVYITDTDKNLDDFIIKIETKGNNLFNLLNGEKSTITTIFNRKSSSLFHP